MGVFFPDDVKATVMNGLGVEIKTQGRIIGTGITVIDKVDIIAFLQQAFHDGFSGSQVEQFRFC